MIEPAESVSPEEIEAFCDAMLAIAQEAETDPELITSAPHDTPVGRVDEARAARNLRVTWTPDEDNE
jgi:glycine dehydrogenase subunit 2